MIGLLLEGRSPEGLLSWLPWRKYRLEAEVQPLVTGGPEVLLLRIPPQVAAGERGWRRIDRTLRRNRVTAVVCSGRLLQQNSAAAGEVLGDYRTVSPDDYAGLFLPNMLKQAASMCRKPPPKCSLCIVDRTAEHLNLELLLAASQLAGQVSIITDRAELLEPVLETLFDRTGLPVQCMQKDRAEADLVLLLSHTGLSVRALLVVDLSGQRARILEGRVFRSVILRLPKELGDAMPSELSPMERTCLAYLLLDRQDFTSLRPDRLL